MGLKYNDHIDVLTKRSSASKYLSRGNIKPFYDEKLRIEINSNEEFFEDLWGIPRDN